MGGVYAPVSEAVQPNPYLDAANRDLHLPNNITLTKINPAYMTRMVAEMAEKKYDVYFHITSLKPIRPANAPTDWEAAALLSFEQQGQKEFMRFDDRAGAFYYMAPLITQKSCLACHEKQGYREGDIRGGISITMNTQPPNLWPLLVSHLVIATLGAGIIFTFYTRLETTFTLLERQSRLDGLTQLFNRGYFDEYFSREYLRSRRMKRPLSVLLCDVDCFKAYNDAYGHQAGDIALKKVAATLLGAARRPADLTARYGGEEFIILLPDTPPEGALAVAETICAQVENLRIDHQGNTAAPWVTVSIGCWTYQGEDIHKEDVLERVDHAMYQAKHNGKNQTIVFSQGMNALASGKISSVSE